MQNSTRVDVETYKKQGEDDWQNWNNEKDSTVQMGIFLSLRTTGWSNVIHEKVLKRYLKL